MEMDDLSKLKKKELAQFLHVNRIEFNKSANKGELLLLVRNLMDYFAQQRLLQQNYTQQFNPPQVTTQQQISNHCNQL